MVSFLDYLCNERNSVISKTIILFLLTLVFLLIIAISVCSMIKVNNNIAKTCFLIVFVVDLFLAGKFFYDLNKRVKK